MGILSGISAVVSLGSSLFGDEEKGTSRGTRAVRPEVAATFAEMGSLSAEFTARMKDERARSRQKTESQNPIQGMVAAMFDEEEKRLPGFITNNNKSSSFNFKNIA